MAGAGKAGQEERHAPERQGKKSPAAGGATAGKEEAAQPQHALSQAALSKSLLDISQALTANLFGLRPLKHGGSGALPPPPPPPPATSHVCVDDVAVKDGMTPAEDVDHVFDMSKADEGQVCVQCHGLTYTGQGRVDESTKQFYCKDCWNEFDCDYASSANRLAVAMALHTPADQMKCSSSGCQGQGNHWAVRGCVSGLCSNCCDLVVDQVCLACQLVRVTKKLKKGKNCKKGKNVAFLPPVEP